MTLEPDTLYTKLTAAKLDKAAEMLRMIAHPVRLAIVDLLGQRAYSNTELQDALVIRQDILSQHLTLMRDKGLLDSRREGKFRYYFLKHADTLNIISCVENCCKHL